MSIVHPVGLSSLRFKKFGAVQFPDPPYTQTEVSAALPLTKSLLAVSNRHATLFLLSASSSASVSILYVASTHRVIESVEADKRAQALQSRSRDADDDGGAASRVQDAPAAEDVFLTVRLQAEGVWLLSLSPADDWLLVGGSNYCALYHMSQFSGLTGGESRDALLRVDAEAVVDVQWSPQHPHVFYTLTKTGQLRCYGIVNGESVQCVLSYDSPASAITAFLPSETADQIILGCADGSLHVGAVVPSASSSFPSTLSLQSSSAPHRPSQDFDAQPALHHISRPSASSLLLGYAQSREEASAPVIDPVHTALCSVSFPSLSSYADYGDLLQDESRFLPYSTRHRYGLLSVPAWRCALPWSNRTGELCLLGEDPAVRRDGAGGGDGGLYVPYELDSDAGRVVIPSDADWNDTFAIGAALELSNRMSTAETEAAEKGAEADAPFPMLLLLTTDARLHFFHFICDQPSMREASALVMRTDTQPLPTSLTAASRLPLPSAASARQSIDRAPSPVAPPVSEEKAAAAPPPAFAAAPLPFSLPTFTFSADAPPPTFSFGSSASSSSSSTASPLFALPSTLSFPAASQPAKPPPAWIPGSFAVSASSSASSSSAGDAPFNFSSAFSSSSTGPLLFGDVSVSLPAQPAVPKPAALPTQPTSLAALAAASKSSGLWECSVCEVMNAADSTVCAACETKRELPAPQAERPAPQPAPAQPVVRAASVPSPPAADATVATASPLPSQSIWASSSGMSSSLPPKQPAASFLTSPAPSSVRFGASVPAPPASTAPPFSFPAPSLPVATPAAAADNDRAAATFGSSSSSTWPVASLPAAGLTAAGSSSARPSPVVPAEQGRSSSDSSAASPSSVAAALAALKEAVRSGGVDQQSVLLALLDIVQEATTAAGESNAAAAATRQSAARPAPAAASSSLSQQPAASKQPPAPAPASAPSAPPPVPREHQIHYPPPPAPPPLPASLSRPVPVLSSLTPADFSSSSVPAAASNATAAAFVDALRSLCEEMERLRELSADGAARVRDAWVQRGAEGGLSLKESYALIGKVRVLEQSCAELRQQCEEEEQNIDRRLSSAVRDGLRDVEQSASLLFQREDPQWRSLLRLQPLDSEAVRLLERIDRKLDALRGRVAEVESWVQDEWSRVKRSGQLGGGGRLYGEEDATAAAIRRVIDSHQAVIDRQKSELRRMEAAMREDRGGAGEARRREEEQRAAGDGGVRLLFSETPMKDIAGRKGWDREEKRRHDDADGDGRLDVAAAGRRNGSAAASVGPIIRSALALPRAQPSSIHPSAPSPARPQPAVRPSSLFSPSVPLSSAAMSRISAAFNEKLRVGASAAVQSRRQEEERQLERRQDRERVQQLMRKGDAPQYRPAAFMSPLPSTLLLRSPPVAPSSHSANAELQRGGGERRWSRSRFSSPQQQAEYEEREREEKRREEEELKQAQQLQQQRMQQHQQQSRQSTAPVAFTPVKSAVQQQQRRLSPRKDGSSSSTSGGLRGDKEAARSSSAAASASSSFVFPSPAAASAPFSLSTPPPSAWQPSLASAALAFGYKSPPPVPVAEEKKEQPRPAAATTAAATSSASSSSKAATAVFPSAAAGLGFSLAPGPSLTSSSPSSLSAFSAPAASASSVPLLPESPSFALKKETVKLPPAAAPAAPAGKPAAQLPASADASAPAASAAAATTATTSASLFSPSTAGVSTSTSAASPSSSSASSSSSATAASASTVASLPAASSVPGGFSFAFSSAPTFSFSKTAAPPSFSLSTSTPPVSAGSASAATVSKAADSSLAAASASSSSSSAAAFAPSASSAALPSSSASAGSLGVESSLLSSSSSLPSFSFPSSSSAASSSFATAPASSSSQDSDFGMGSLASALNDTNSASAAASHPFPASGSNATSASPFGTASFPTTSFSGAAALPSAFASPFGAPNAAAAPSASLFPAPGSSASSLTSFSSLFGSQSSSAASPFGGSVFGSSASNPFQQPAPAETANAFSLPSQPSLGQQPFGAPAASSASPFAPSSSSPFSLTGSSPVSSVIPSLADPFGSSSAFASGFGQSFSSAAFGGGGAAGSSNSTIFAAPPAAAPAFGQSGFGFGQGAGGGGGGGFANFASGGGGFGAFAQQGGGSSFTQLAASAGGGGGGGGFASFAPAGGQQGGGGGWGLAAGAGGGAGMPQMSAPQFSGFRS